jgi:hypothetical protein
VAAKNIGDCAASQLMSQRAQCTLNAAITPMISVF